MVTRTKPNALVIGGYRDRAGIIDALRGSTFEVIEATEGRRGIKHILNDAPNVVIIGGVANAADRLRLVRAIRCLTSAPILIIGSGCETGADERDLHLHGANGFIPHSRRLEMTSVYVHTLLSRN